MSEESHELKDSMKDVEEEYSSTNKKGQKRKRPITTDEEIQEQGKPGERPETTNEEELTVEDWFMRGSESSKRENYIQAIEEFNNTARLANNEKNWRYFLAAISKIGLCHEFIQMNFCRQAIIVTQTHGIPLSNSFFERIKNPYIINVLSSDCHRGKDGITKDFRLAFKLSAKNAQQGNAIGLHNTGLYYINGTGVEKNFEKGFFLIKKAADFINPLPRSPYLTAKYYAVGTGVEKNTLESWKYIQQVINLTCSHILQKQKILEEEIGIKPTPNELRKFIDKSTPGYGYGVSALEILAHVALALKKDNLIENIEDVKEIFSNPENVQDPRYYQALESIISNANLWTHEKRVVLPENLLDQTTLAHSQQNESNKDQNELNDIFHQLLVSAASVETTQNSMQEAPATFSSSTTALPKTWKKSSVAGSEQLPPPLQRDNRDMKDERPETTNEEGLTVEDWLERANKSLKGKNYKQAAEEFENAAKQASAIQDWASFIVAMSNVGLCHEFSQISFYRQAVIVSQLNEFLLTADFFKGINNPHICNILAGDCQYGKNGITRNFKLAFKFAEKSAKQGDLIGLHHTGLYYINGMGVSKNPNKGFLLIKKSADFINPLPGSSYVIAKCYATGTGIEKNALESWKYIHQIINLTGSETLKKQKELERKMGKRLNLNELEKLIDKSNPEYIFGFYTLKISAHLLLALKKNNLIENIEDLERILITSEKFQDFRYRQVLENILSNPKYWASIPGIAFPGNSLDHATLAHSEQPESPEDENELNDIFNQLLLFTASVQTAQDTLQQVSAVSSSSSVAALTNTWERSGVAASRHSPLPLESKRENQNMNNEDEKAEFGSRNEIAGAQAL